MVSDGKPGDFYWIPCLFVLVDQSPLFPSSPSSIRQPSVALWLSLSLATDFATITFCWLVAFSCVLHSGIVPIQVLSKPRCTYWRDPDISSPFCRGHNLRLGNELQLPPPVATCLAWSPLRVMVRVGSCITLLNGHIPSPHCTSCPAAGRRVSVYHSWCYLQSMSSILAC